MAERYLKNLGLKPWVYRNPQYYDSFWFEKVDGNELRVWAKQQLPAFTAIGGLYLLFVHYGPQWMKNRKPFDLRRPLLLWNLLLAIFSICGVIRILPEILFLISLPNGFHRSACHVEGVHYPMSFWGFAFTVSKAIEAGDTVFIVLRKKPLIFLHWFHHSTMMVATVWGYAEGEPIARYGALLNFSVHSIMYTYYFVKALRIKVPRKISMMITIVQILQFIAGLSVCFYTLISYATGGDCYRTVDSILLSFVLVGSYLYLFSKLFYNSYICKSKTKCD